jgi:hypothetical protein
MIPRASFFHLELDFKILVVIVPVVKSMVSNKL